MKGEGEDRRRGLEDLQTTMQLQKSFNISTESQNKDYPQRNHCIGQKWSDPKTSTRVRDGMWGNFLGIVSLAQKSTANPES